MPLLSLSMLFRRALTCDVENGSLRSASSAFNSVASMVPIQSHGAQTLNEERCRDSTFQQTECRHPQHGPIIAHHTVSIGIVFVVESLHKIMETFVLGARFEKR